MRERGLLTMVGSSDDDAGRERELAEAFSSRRIDGLVLLPAGKDHSYLRADRDAGVAMVFVDRPPALLEADAVMSDNAGGAAAATEHLIAHGHRRIGFLGDELRIHTAAERLRGHRAALARHGIAEDPALIRTGLRNSAAASEAVAGLLALSPPPTALLTAQNLITVGAIHRLRALDRHHAVAMIGFDDLELADALEPGLSVIAQDARAIGPHGRRAAVRAAGRGERRVPAHRGADDADRARLGGAGGMIVVGGEALIDLVAADGDQLGAHAGGGPFSTSRVLGRLERPVAYLGRLSTDRFGERLAGLLAADGVRLDLAVRTEDPTTLALAELDASGSATYRFYFEGTSAPGLTAADADAVDDAVEILHVGTLGLVFEPMAATLEALAARLAGRALVMVDPNCRPAVIADAAAYRARIRRVLGSSDVVKVSEEDLAWLSPGVPAEDAAVALLAQGPRVVLLTRGGAGATVLTADGETDIPAPPVRVVDTIGAGDAFSGGWLAWWSEQGHGREQLGEPALLAEATRFAVRVAAETCARAGASPPTRAELDA